MIDGQKINVNTTLIPTMLFKKECLFQNVDPVVIDYDFFLRAGILFNTKFHLISDSLIQYRIHPRQLSHKSISKSLNCLSNIKENVISELNEAARSKYVDALEKFNKSKSLSNKIMNFGLSVAIKTLPNYVSNQLLTFYLNKIRQTR